MMEVEMAVIKRFLGQCIQIPEDRRYDSKQGLWAKVQDPYLIFGLTNAALILAGGVNDLDWLVEDQVSVASGQDVAFAITGKILYLSTPVAGVVSFNPEVKQDPSLASQDPYEKGWLFRIQPDGGGNEAWQTLADALAYTKSLRGTEGFKNPDGLKGGVSGICKAVYSGISKQKI
jgi:glycine cleavage system H protein